MKKLLETISWWANNYRVVAAAKTNSAMPTPAQVADESYRFWTSQTTNPLAVFALMGNEEGETSFILGVVGDKKTGGAHGIFQWHQARIDDIRKGCGIDILVASHADQLRAAHYEMSQGAYKHVWQKLIACTTLQDAVTVLVHDFERSSMQDRDVQRRTAFAQAWQTRYQKNTTGGK